MEEMKVRRAPAEGPISSGQEMFNDENIRDVFWAFDLPKEYMRNRALLVRALLNAKTYAAVSATHDHLMAVLRFCPSDSMDTGDLLPTLRMRLGKDQECYNFCVLWANADKVSVLQLN